MQFIKMSMFRKLMYINFDIHTSDEDFFEGI